MRKKAALLMALVMTLSALSALPMNVFGDDPTWVPTGLPGSVVQFGFTAESVRRVSVFLDYRNSFNEVPVDNLVVTAILHGGGTDTRPLRKLTATLEVI